MGHPKLSTSLVVCNGILVLKLSDYCVAGEHACPQVFSKFRSVLTPQTPLQPS